ncbi:class III extradiol dioxygenase subunit B-like domain-containing protein [Saccharomonospora sp. NB11]|uniref:class III extradiol dioxygenase subunit B-like domain-containing protein n=1 Tax=Saccharomonospora sp. NB11 TaxID=1642298 RepID=UPI0018D03096|nr:class III extradiol dioxygenase subunit B-like domain-containing protein [Saccharomonospora sp. NB11]
MITCAVVVPSPPLLVPALVPGAVERSAAVRDATVSVVRALAQVGRRWVAVGVAAARQTVRPSARGSFGGFGVDVPVALSDSATEDRRRSMPLPALLAGWLREQAGAESVRVELVDAGASVEDCVALGEQLARSDETALLVLGDGSTRHASAPPGWADPRAEPFDTVVRTALAEADDEALLSLDPELAVELQAEGRAAWQVLAGLARSTGDWSGELWYSDAPFGVAYHVAKWTRS